jgi:hypothetical protein
MRIYGSQPRPSASSHHEENDPAEPSSRGLQRVRGYAAYPYAGGSAGYVERIQGGLFSSRMGLRHASASSRVSTRIAVEFGNGIAPTTVFPGHHAVVQAGDGQADVIVNRAIQYVCWDETCAGDDSGPFERLDLLIVGR